MTLCRVACDLLDLLVLVMRRTLLRDTRDHVRRSPHSSVVRAMSHNSKYSQEETADHVGTYWTPSSGWREVSPLPC